jgi:ASCH domain
MKPPRVALSLKQPWAALVVHGLKSIEIRRWATERRGRIYVHASKTPDPRPEAWAWLPDPLKPAAAIVGGLIGTVEITGCVPYSDVATFRTDRFLHFNDAAWFKPPMMYGFLLAHAKPVAFRPIIGNIKFFPVGPEK